METYKIAIWGWGVTGRASFNYFTKSKDYQDLNLEIDIYDGSEINFPRQENEPRKNLDINFFPNHNYLENIEKYDILIISPSIPETHQSVIEARNLGKSVFNDASYFVKKWRELGKKSIGVTGSNGKTTVSSLLYEILQKTGIKTTLVGNIGKSPLDILLQIERGEIEVDLPVIELSSYQLETFNETEYVDYAIITNISPNHLDHHENSMEKYVGAKLKIAGEETKIITVLDDPGIQKYVLPKIKNPHLVSLENLEDQNQKSDLEYFADSNHRKLKGEHNLYNIAIVLKMLEILEIKSEKTKEIIKNYSGLEHRIEFVKEIHGVKYINDSKSTSPDSVRVALETFGNHRNIILIAGGNEKNTSFEFLREHFNQYVKNLIVLKHHIDQKLIKLADKNQIPHSSFDNLKDCVSEAKSKSLSGDIILFSPGSGSQPKFKNFEERGKIFKEIVLTIGD